MQTIARGERLRTDERGGTGPRRAPRRRAGRQPEDAIREAIRQGARGELIRIALERYREGKVGMRGAAELAGVTIAEMRHQANERGVLQNYDEADLEADVDALR